MLSDNSVAEAEHRINQSLARIQVCLGAEDWLGVEAIVSRLPELVESVPAADSAAILRVVCDCLETVRIHVESRSDAIGSQLSSLKQGRIATRAYQASSQVPHDA